MDLAIRNKNQKLLCSLVISNFLPASIEFVELRRGSGAQRPALGRHSLGRKPGSRQLDL